jgi:hypothetical protein
MIRHTLLPSRALWGELGDSQLWLEVSNGSMAPRGTLKGLYLPIFCGRLTGLLTSYHSGLSPKFPEVPKFEVE